ncbi:hypothetical protein WR25_18880 [Diploscapter pachys]|uniref:Uncharacterized protein n=1 Tax=Diploscapter pachys TaxID=2018661 RepID=A0A2A2M5N1_9BILA|nr:hypothetical protein WR25_18880 [Diploscapter pachys]
MTADGRQPGQRRRTLAAIEHTDQQLAGVQFQNDLGHRWRQADYPRRSLGQSTEAQQRKTGEQRPHQPSWRGMR